MSKKKNKKKEISGETRGTNDLQPLSQAQPVNEIHGMVIDEYFVNGFNAAQAMLTVQPELNYNTAGVKANAILSNDRNKAYLQQKRSQLRADTDIRNENLLKELMNWAFVDVTKFMTLSEEEIQALPDDIKRCIQGFEIYEKTAVDIKGTEYKTKKIKLTFVSKKDAMESIAKHIGFYLLDNEQKRTKINLQKVDATILNGFLQAIEYNDTDE